MKTITKRELSRNPALLSQLKPGESIAVSDREGGLTLRREKRIKLTVEDMEAQTEALQSQCPSMDTLAFLREGEA